MALLLQVPKGKYIAILGSKKSKAERIIIADTKEDLWIETRQNGLVDYIIYEDIIRGEPDEDIQTY